MRYIKRKIAIDLKDNVRACSRGRIEGGEFVLNGEVIGELDAPQWLAGWLFLDQPCDG